MKCPFTLEPHQIQGLDFINIYPVIQWLVKESVNLRAERSEKSKKFAVSEFHNHFKMITSDNSRQERQRALQNIREIDNLYSAKRIFKRKYNAEPEDEKSRVRLTLLEYGIKNLTRHLPRSDDGSASTFDRSMSGDDEEECDDEVRMTMRMTLLSMKFERDEICMNLRFLCSRFHYNALDRC